MPSLTAHSVDARASEAAVCWVHAAPSGERWWSPTIARPYSRMSFKCAAPKPKQHPQAQLYA